MPRKRNPENKGLPERWRKKHGAFFYQVPAGKEHLWDGKKEFRLGKTLPEAHRKWADRIGDMENVRTVGQLLERYEREVIYTKAKRTAAENARYCATLRKVFGHMSLPAITPQIVYQYVDRRSKKKLDEETGKTTGGTTIARLEKALLSHAFTKAVQWGYIGRHPFKGEVRIKGTKARDRYVEDWEVEECLSLPMPKGRSSLRMLKAYIRIKCLIGLRQIDMLGIAVADMKEDGIYVTPSKTEGSTGKSMIITWTDELRAAVKEALDARPVDISPWLFCTMKGQRYEVNEKGECSGFKSIWQRFMTRALKETKVEERFTEHDLRAKTGSDSETDQQAQARLGHADAKTTKKYYRRKAEVVTPLR